MPTIARAENMQIDANILFAAPDAGGSDNFHTGKIVSINYNYYFHSWLVVTAGIFISEEISTEPEEDVVSTFQATVESKGLTLGLRSEYILSEQNKLYARAGLLFYETELTVEDYFQAGLPLLSASDTTDGQGYYVSLAWAHSLTKQVTLQIELANMTQLDLFKGNQKSFDLKTTGISFGIGYAF